MPFTPVGCFSWSTSWLIILYGPPSPSYSENMPGRMRDANKDSAFRATAVLTARWITPSSILSTARNTSTRSASSRTTATSDKSKNAGWLMFRRHCLTWTRPSPRSGNSSTTGSRVWWRTTPVCFPRATISGTALTGINSRWTARRYRQACGERFLARLQRSCRRVCCRRGV